MLPVTLTQTREERVDIFEIVAELILAQICAYLQVLEDGKVRENSASLGDESYAACDYLIRGQSHNALSVQENVTACGAYDSRYRAENGRFTRAVCTDEGDYLPIPDIH